MTLATLSSGSRSPQRNLGNVVFFSACNLPLNWISKQDSKCNGVDANAKRPQLLGQIHGQIDNSGFGNRIVDTDVDAANAGCQRRQIDNLAALLGSLACMSSANSRQVQNTPLKLKSISRFHSSRSNPFNSYV